mmetsp:Transcript_8173/g.12936  ORF Transcript_8173/g.12936 Transcript_8173/m.12936 type:complete len:81 (+) Transcript_8173:294-536(+)
MSQGSTGLRDFVQMGRLRGLSVRGVRSTFPLPTAPLGGNNTASSAPAFLTSRCPQFLEELFTGSTDGAPDGFVAPEGGCF